MTHADDVVARAQVQHAGVLRVGRAHHDRVATTTTWRNLKIAVTASLDHIEPEWRRFEKAADGTVFQSFDWLSTWQRCIGEPSGVTPAIVTARQPNGEFLFIFPLAIERLRAARALTFLGRSLCDYNAPLLAPEFRTFVGADSFPELWAAIRALLAGNARFRHDLVLLDKMPETLGAQPNPFALLKGSVNPSGAYLTALTDDWDSFYVAKRSSATRRRDRTKRKKLGETGELRMTTPAAPADVLRSLDILIAQKSRAFARMGVPDIFARSGHSAFFAQLAERAPGLVHISRLDIGDTPAATNLGLVFRERYYHILASYDDGPLSRFGPGSIHLQELMRYAIAQGCSTFDFTIGDEPYKRDWCDTELTLRDHISAATLKGTAIAGTVAALRSGKRAIKQSRLWPFLTRMRARFVGSQARKKDATSPDAQDA